MAPRCQIVDPSESIPSFPSPAPTSQPSEPQETFALDDVSGGDVEGNDPDAIAKPKDDVTDIQYFFDKSGDKVKCKECL